MDHKNVRILAGIDSGFDLALEFLDPEQLLRPPSTMAWSLGKGLVLEDDSQSAGAFIFANRVDDVDVIRAS
ncbi:hypothetical protein [Sinorhizobium meliloti]|uniref:hypothetical protein n=1 Tax=Rhizobium meliloti TaxID=382 RepID=UPI001F3B432D|nr:hypothetical protein [Sinorhizobium meliloti]